MAVEVVMPKMGESIQEGKILKWLKKPGEHIERDETLLEISTDKVDTEVPSPVAGIVSQLLYNENDTVEVGKVIAIIGGDVQGTAPSASKPEPAPAPAPAPVPAPAPAPAPAPVAAAATPSSAGATDVVMPKMGESIQEGKVLRWVKNVGDRVERDETIVEISTDKVDTEVPSPIAGILVERLANEGDVLEVGKVLARISTGAAAPAASAPAAAPAAPATPAAAPTPSSVAAASHAVPSVQMSTHGGGSIPRRSGERFYSPLVRAIAEGEGVSLAQLDGIAGSGLEGRVTKADMMNFLAQRGSAPVVAAAAPAPVAAPAPAATVNLSQSGSAVVSAPAARPMSADVEVIPMDRVRTLIAEHMVRSKLTSPHVTSVAEADVTNIVKLREKRKSAFEKENGYKLTLTPFFVKAIVDAVQQFPLVNVSVDGTNIIRYKHVNFGFATLLPDGNLIVPVIKNAEMMNLRGISSSISDLANRARTKKLQPDEIQGGTISLTNMGPWGSLFGTPVINQPQSAIIGVYAVQKRPVVREINGEDAILIRHMMYVTITYDHRVIDGALGSGCLNAIVQNLQNMNESSVDI